MVEVNGSVVIQIINFVLLIFVLNAVLYKPIRNILLQRKEKIGGLEKGIESSQEGARAKEEAFDEGIKKARMEGLKAKEKLIAEATDEEKKMIEKINQQAQANLAEIRSRVGREAEAARQALEKEVDNFAQAIGQKILGRAV